MVYFAKYIKNIKNRNYSYRFLFTPETIGPLAYYYKDKNKTNIVGGLNLNNLAYKDIFHYTRSRVGRSIVDKAIDYINWKKKYKLNINNYSVVSGRSGNEKAYNSLVLEYPVGSLTRSLAGSYKEYDTDKDNLEFINKNKFLESYNLLIDLFYVIENEKLVKNNFKGEPFLTGYGLFSDIEDIKNRKIYDYLISSADGKKTLLDFSIEQKFDLNILSTVASKLLNKKILKIKPYKIL
jgi:aminopeptidase-like protein